MCLLELKKPERALLSVCTYLHRWCKRSHHILVLQVHFRLIQQGIWIQLMWVPAHVGLRRNEPADRSAKQAPQRGTTGLQEPLSKAEVKGRVWNKAAEEWREQRNAGIRGRFLHQCNNKVSSSFRHIGRSRKDRIRLGHFTRRIGGKHPAGSCEQCQESAVHVIIITILLLI